MQEKEKKRLQQEAERDEKRREKEESEMRKQLKRKQEEAEREQRRKEKEEAELKKQLAIQKQASIMERFLKKSRTAVTSQSEESPKAATFKSLPSGSTLEPVSLQMDTALQHQEEIDVDEIRKYALYCWTLVFLFSGVSLFMWLNFVHVDYLRPSSFTGLIWVLGAA